MSIANKEHKVRPSAHFTKNHLTPLPQENSSQKGFFDKVVVNMTSCSEFDDDDGETNEEHSVPLTRDDKVRTVLEALPVHMGWQQVFHLSEEMREQIVVVIAKRSYMLTR